MLNTSVPPNEILSSSETLMLSDEAELTGQATLIPLSKARTILNNEFSQKSIEGSNNVKASFQTNLLLPEHLKRSYRQLSSSEYLEQRRRRSESYLKASQSSKLFSEDNLVTLFSSKETRKSSSFPDLKHNKIIDNRNDLNEQKPAKKVCFSSVEVREYEQILCVNPACTSGPSIGIGWNYNHDSVNYIDINKRNIDESRWRKRVGTKCLTLNAKERENMLFRLGYDRQQILHAIKSQNSIKNQRRLTVISMKLGENIDSFKIQIKRILGSAA